MRLQLAPQLVLLLRSRVGNDQVQWLQLLQAVVVAAAVVVAVVLWRLRHPP